MKVLVQRVTEAGVSVEGRTVAEIGHGFLVLLCVVTGDDADDAAFLARKTANLRIFDDAAGKMNRSLVDTGGSALVVSQFTLAADTSRGTRRHHVRRALAQRGILVELPPAQLNNCLDGDLGRRADAGVDQGATQDARRQRRAERHGHQYRRAPSGSV